MKKSKLKNGKEVFCINSIEAQILHEHIDGYFDNFINFKKNDTIIDVGANIGIFGLELSARYPNINIISFEPIINIISILKANASISNNKYFKVYNYGISDKAESIEFTYFPNAPALSSSNDEIWNSGDELIEAFGGSLENAPEKLWWKNFVPKFTYPYFAKRLIKNQTKINCTVKPLSIVIDSLSIEKIDLLKIDCEGNEQKVIDGIEKNNWDIIKQLIIEINDIEGRLDYIKSKLIKLGYTTRIIQEASLKNTKLYNLFAKK